MSFENDAASCRLLGICSGCAWLAEPLATQHERKRAELAGLLAKAGVALPEGTGIELHAVDARGTGGLRDRADLSWKRTSSGALHLGLYDVSRQHIVDIERCPAMSQKLEAWLEVFRGNIPPLIEKGSVRLRVSPEGTRGVWLDLANLDVKRLLEEREWLLWLTGVAEVEIGQRFKPLRFARERDLKLEGEPRPQAWFETYVGASLTPAPLYGVVGSFTQPGFAANRGLVATIQELLTGLERGKALELFSGLGNFTLPLASFGYEVSAFEVDAVSVACFERTLQAQPELAKRIHATQKNLYSPKCLPPLEGQKLMLVDPPRSGLRDVLNLISEATPEQRPQALVYVSCFAESLASDVGLLVGACGYEFVRVVGVDQFPGSPHCEWVGLLVQSKIG